VFGSAPKAILSPQNNFDFVCSWACTSSPTTIWYLSIKFIAAKI